LLPFNPERVLRDTPKPPAELTVLKEVKVGSCPQDEVLQTLVTPVITEALASLHNLIKWNPYTIDETSKQRLQRHVQKLASAAQISFAERALLQDQNRFLSSMNNEAEVRRTTKSVVLGKAKVMSYEDLTEARVKRAVKDKASEGKGKRGRKRKSPAPEPKTKVARMSEVLEPWRALVARMVVEDWIAA